MNVIVLLFLFLRARSLKAASVDSLAVLASNNERLTVSNLENDDFPSSDEEEGPYDTVILWGVKPVRRVRFDLPDEVPIVTAPKASPTSVAQIFDEWDDFKCDLEWIKSGLISTFERGEMIPNRIIKKIIEDASFWFSMDNSVHKIPVPKNGKVIVVGDIHGQFESTLSIFEQFGYPSKDLVYLFNGDIVDRGDKSLECILMVFAYKIALPNSFFVTRGNHESRTVAKEGFFEECQCKLADYEEAFEDFHNAFDKLPYGYIIKKMFVTHGGLSEDVCLEDIQYLFRTYFDHTNTIEFYAMLWNDPCEADCPVDSDGMAPNPRGKWCQKFSPEVTHSFLLEHGLELLVRSHQAVPDGYLMSQGNRCLTIFSAPNYLGRNNRGAVLIIDEAQTLLGQMAYFNSTSSNK